MKVPDFWYDQEASLLSNFLGPVGWIYGFISTIRQDRAKPWQATIPIICIGNLVAGGQGKTPTALSIGNALKAHGKSIHFISRGYGGSIRKLVLVDPYTHSAKEVGDEPLLLAQIAPTWISANRKIGIEAACKAGAEIIVMDDGFQNPSVIKNLGIIVIDGETGFGNGRLIPAGPLRENIPAGLSRAQAVIIIGKDPFDLKNTISNLAKKILQKPIKVFAASLLPNDVAAKLKNTKVFAFAGIGRPEKFFTTLREIGVELVGTKAFTDHHPYSKKEINHLLQLAKRKKAILVTTTKDHVRLPIEQKKDVRTVSVTLDWTDTNALDKLIKPFI
jgi:tetraacyldisaccharide 4'-kinase